MCFSYTTFFFTNAWTKLLKILETYWSDNPEINSWIYDQLIFLHMMCTVCVCNFRLGIWCSHICLHFIYWGRVSQMSLQHDSQLVWLASLPWSSLSASVCWHHRQTSQVPSLYVGSGDPYSNPPNSGPHTCVASALPTELPLQFSKVICKKGAKTIQWRKAQSVLELVHIHTQKTDTELILQFIQSSTW